MVIVVDVSSGISGELEEGTNVGVVDGPESKTLVENPRDKGVLSDGARVLDVESSTESVIDSTRKDSIEFSKTRSRSNKWDSWESWGVMNMVRRVLGGTLSVDDDEEVDNEMRKANTAEEEVVSDSENGREVNGVKKEKVVKNLNEDNLEASRDGGRKENLAADRDAWQGLIEEPIYVGKSDVERFVADEDSDELVLDKIDAERFIIGDDESDELIQDGLAMGDGLKGDPDLLSNEWVQDGMGLNADRDTLSNELGPDLVNMKGDLDFLSNELVPGVKGQDSLSSKWAPDGKDLIGDEDLLSKYLVTHGLLQNKVNEVEGHKTCLIPKTRGEHQITEKEGEYYVSDLVWGKVRGHPWWPGQIFLPTAASDKAKTYYKKPSYLVAYFGDQSFAWNEGLNIKPFHMYFSQMEKQSSSDRFCYSVSCALDEVARRIEFGLSCECLSEEVRDKFEIGVVSNAGIHEEKNKVYGGDNLLSPASFSPGNLVHFLESLAASPQTEINSLEFLMKKAQLLAFSRWKGHYELPIFEQYVGQLEDDDVEVTDDFSSNKRKSTAGDGSSQKRRHLLGDKEFPTLKEKLISALISSDSSVLPNADEKPVKRAARRSVSSGKNIKSTNSNPRVKKRRTVSPIIQICDGGKGWEEPEMVEIIPSGIPTPDEILSKLTLAAKIPIQGFRVMVSEVDFLREFRHSICFEKSSSSNAEMDFVMKLKGKEPVDLDTAESTFGFEGITNDSYWTDMIIQSSSQEPVLFEPKNTYNKAAQVDNTLFLDLGSEKMPPDEYQPTALILNFTNLESIPSITNLNEIFNSYGPLNESETQILSKSKRVKVIFRRRVDAETAFNSTGKYSIFGPSLVSYKLRYAPTQRKSRGTSKRAKKDGSEKVDT